MVSDIIIIVVFALFTILGIRRGAAKTLLNFAALIANSFISRFLAAGIAQAVYNNLIKENVIGNIENLITQNGAQYAVEHSLDALPGWVMKLVGVTTGTFGVTPEQLQGRLAPSAEQSRQLAQTIEQPVSELAITVLSFLLMIVIFIVLMIVFKLLIKMALRVFEIPFIRQANMALGGVLGVLEAIVFIWLVVNTLYVVISYANPNLTDNGTLFGSLFHMMCFLK